MDGLVECTLSSTPLVQGSFSTRLAVHWEPAKETTMPGRTFSREFKLEVVRQVMSGAKRPAQACREYGLAESVLNRWRKEYGWWFNQGRHARL